jgi:tRNA uridine 5-carboxymethylaminomethyl modification enzyme
LVDDERWQFFSVKREAVERETERLKRTLVRPDDLANSERTLLGGPLRREQKALELLKRPELEYAFVTGISSVGHREQDAAETPELAEQIENQVEIQARYHGYVARQTKEIEKNRKHSTTSLPADLDYDQVRGLSHEIRQKLFDVRPTTIGQASRISGMTPVAVSLLLVHLKKRYLKSA